MAKVNASTGQVIKKNNADVHAPHDLEPVHPDQQLEEQADSAYDMTRDKQAILDRVDPDDTEEDADDNASDGPEEELSLIDDSDDQ